MNRHCLNLFSACLTGLFLLPLAALTALSCAAPASAQVAITGGVQQIYDDNIFLENDRRRPAPFVSGDTLEQDLQDGTLSTLYSEENDGDPNDDMITNVYLDFATNVERIKNVAETNVTGRVGGLFFADQGDQDRLTLDGAIDMTASEHVVPKPLFMTLNGTLTSESNNITVAEGTAASTRETVTGAGSFGYRDEIFAKTTYELAYTGAYHHDIGDLRFDDPVGGEELEDEGADYHSHTGSTSLDYEVTEKWKVGVAGDYGVQYYIDSGATNIDGTPVETGELDRTNATVVGQTEYKASERFSMRGSAGVGFENLMDTPEPIETTVIDENGQEVTVVSAAEDSNSSFIFSADATYIPAAGSTATIGALQTLTSDYNGNPIITRTAFLNSTLAFTDRLLFIAAGSFTQYSGGDSLTDATDQLQLSGSFSFSVTQNTALVLGYNFVKQNADETSIEDQLRFTLDDYTGHRVFLGITSGFVGLPL